MRLFVVLEMTKESSGTRRERRFKPRGLENKSAIKYLWITKLRKHLFFKLGLVVLVGFKCLLRLCGV